MRERFAFAWPRTAVRFDPWYRDVERSCSLKDWEHIGSTAKVVCYGLQKKENDPFRYL